MSYILYDLNAMDPVVGVPDSLMLKDTKVVVQAVQRLITSEVFSIPNYRSYGLSLKRFSQYPLTKQTASAIYNYVKERIEVFVDSAEVLKAESDVDFDRGELYFTFYLRVRQTQQVATISFSVNLSSSQLTLT